MIVIITIIIIMVVIKIRNNIISYINNILLNK
jgi:hypothetical protein